ncbi:MAG: hypothetical protein NC200_03425 [Candidatus Gastranaerophilales bacterium]|nr:hypothetical protein [Candidatus Gastranaerophilales bacterium]
MKIFELVKSEKYNILIILGLKIKFPRANFKYRQLNDKYTRLEYLLCKYLSSAKYSEYLKDWYYEQTGEFLNLDYPQTFNEKIQWLKLNDSTDIKTQLADKYLVRNWIKEMLGEEYLISLLGVYNKFDDIDFEKLPDKFVLKTNHAAGYNLIVTDKAKIDKHIIKLKFDRWLNTNYAFVNGLELHYKNIKPLIIIEEYLENNNKELNDYKFYCFGGKVQYIQYISERTAGYKMVFFDREWNPQDFISNNTKLEDSPPRPQCLDEVIEKVEKLAEGFNFVRVDFYVLDNGDVKFGEMTFTPGSGVLNWQPKEANLMMGDLLKLGK